MVSALGAGAVICADAGVISSSDAKTVAGLASGLLSGKYLDGIPANSRATLPGYGALVDGLTDPQANRSVRELKQVADDLGVTLAQLSIAWCAANPHVSTVITGASRAEQVRENLGALDVLAQLDDGVMHRIDEALMENRARFS